MFISIISLGKRANSVEGNLSPWSIRRDMRGRRGMGRLLWMFPLLTFLAGCNIIFNVSEHSSPKESKGRPLISLMESLMGRVSLGVHMVHDDCPHLLGDNDTISIFIIEMHLP
jgi:hypothetical protein